jgi:TolA-binding protein
VTTNKGRRTKGEGPKAKRWRFVLAPLSFVLCTAAGCTWDQFNPFAKADLPKGATQESVVLRPDGLGPANLTAAETNPDLIAAKDVARGGDHAKAEKLFHKIAEKVKDEPVVAEDARFHEAECLRMQGCYPKAADTYIKLLNEFGGRGLHREQAVEQLFNIANFWLEDTRKEMEEAKDKAAGKRWFTTPHFVNFDKSKPLLDEEGRAIEALEHVYYNGINGKFADKALFMIGTVKFFNEDYREADYQFTQIVEKCKDSPLYPRAAEMAIMAKNLSTGGSDYDGRKCAEARDMIPIALMSYKATGQQDPQAAEKQEFLRRQLAGITLQQAEKDYKVAEFYLRTKRPESAFFLFEVVRRRYAGTKYADMATEQMHNIRDRVGKENGAKLPVPEASPLQPEGPQFYQNVPGAPQQAPAAAPAQEPNAFGQPRPLPQNMQR